MQTTNITWTGVYVGKAPNPKHRWTCKACCCYMGCTEQRPCTARICVAALPCDQFASNNQKYHLHMAPNNTLHCKMPFSVCKHHGEHTRKRASTALNMLRSMSTPPTVFLLTMVRLLHMATACFSLLLQRRALCWMGWNSPLCTGNTPASLVCKTTALLKCQDVKKRLQNLVYLVWYMVAMHIRL